MKDLPEDIKSNWLNVVRHAQAVCHGNEGVAIITLKVAVIGNVPIVWKEANISKIHPKSAIENVECIEPILHLLVDNS